MALPRLFYRTAGRGLCLTKSRLTSSQDIQLVLELYYNKWKYHSLSRSCSPNNINILQNLIFLLNTISCWASSASVLALHYNIDIPSPKTSGSPSPPDLHITGMFSGWLVLLSVWSCCPIITSPLGYFTPI